MWGFGSALFQDQLVDWRNEFSKWFCNEFKQIKFPSTGNVFSFFIDSETKKWLPWSEKVESFELDPDLPLQVIFGYLCLLLPISKVYYSGVDTYNAFCSHIGLTCSSFIIYLVIKH